MSRNSYSSAVPILTLGSFLIPWLICATLGTLLLVKSAPLRIRISPATPIVMRVELQEPKPFTRTWISDKTKLPVTFSWKWRENATNSNMGIEISSDPGFSPEATRRLSVKSESTQVTFSLEQGQFHWRLVQGNDPMSEAREFRIESAILPQTLSPKSDSVVERGPGGGIVFRWAPFIPFSQLPPAWGKWPEIATQLEVSSQPSFDAFEIKQAIRPESGQIEVPQLKDGTWYWRISTSYPNLEVWSTVSPFRVSRAVGRVAKRTWLQTPSDGQKIFYLNSPIPFSFSWDAIPVGEPYYYQMDVGTDGKLRKVVARHKTKETIVSSQALALPPGEYFWRVTLHSIAGKMLNQSEINRFTYGLKPLPGPPGGAAVDTPGRREIFQDNSGPPSPPESSVETE